MKPDKLAQRWQKQQARAELGSKDLARQAVRQMDLDAQVVQMAQEAVVDVAPGGVPGRLVCSNRLVLARRSYER